MAGVALPADESTDGLQRIEQQFSEEGEVSGANSGKITRIDSPKPAIVWSIVGLSSRRKPACVPIGSKTPDY